MLLILISDPPGPPGKPQAIDTSEDSITLNWTKPLKDGGSPIQGYVVEKREKGDSRWIKSSFSLIPDTKYKVDFQHYCKENSNA